MKFLLSLILFVYPLFALDVPYLSGRVNDYAGILTNNKIQELEKKLKDHETATSNQVVVLTMRSLEGENLEEFSLKVAETWKLGQKDKDNGVLLLIAKNDRKLRIEVGYGLEGVLTDALCAQIIRNEITPEFKSGNFDTGVEKGVDSILNAIKGEYKPSDETGTSPDPSKVADTVSDGMPLVAQLFMGMVFVIVVGTHTFSALFFEGGFGWFHYLFMIPFYAAFPMIILGSKGVIVLIAYVIGFPIAKVVYVPSKAGKKISQKFGKNFKRSGKGGSSSGGWSGGGSSGGFSGGGGSFGGGGSSGSW